MNNCSHLQLKIDLPYPASDSEKASIGIVSVRFFFLSLSIFYHWNGNWTCTTMIERIHSSTMQEGNGSNNNILLMSERGSDSQCILTSQTNIKYRPFIYAFESCLMNFIDLLPQHSLFLSAKLRKIKHLHTHTQFQATWPSDSWLLFRIFGKTVNLHNKCKHKSFFLFFFSSVMFRSIIIIYVKWFRCGWRLMDMKVVGYYIEARKGLVGEMTFIKFRILTKLIIISIFLEKRFTIKWIMNCVWILGC